MQLEAEQMDRLRELLNIGAGHAAGAFAQLAPLRRPLDLIECTPARLEQRLIAAKLNIWHREGILRWRCVWRAEIGGGVPLEPLGDGEISRVAWNLKVEVRRKEDSLVTRSIREQRL